MLRRKALHVALGLLVCGCGGRQPGTDQDLIEKVCVHAMAVARQEQVGDFTMEQCRLELQKRAVTLGPGFHAWAHCLLQMNSIEEAKLTCRESDFLQPS